MRQACARCAVAGTLTRSLLAATLVIMIGGPWAQPGRAQDDRDPFRRVVKPVPESAAPGRPRRTAESGRLGVFGPKCTGLWTPQQLADQLRPTGKILTADELAQSPLHRLLAAFALALLQQLANDKNPASGSPRPGPSPSAAPPSPSVGGP